MFSIYRKNEKMKEGRKKECRGGRKHTIIASGAGRDLQQTTFPLICQQRLPSTGEDTPETQNRRGGRLRMNEYGGSDGGKEGQGSSGNLALTQLSSTSRTFYAVRGISSPGLRVTGDTQGER